MRQAGDEQLRGPRGTIALKHRVLTVLLMVVRASCSPSSNFTFYLWMHLSISHSAWHRVESL